MNMYVVLLRRTGKCKFTPNLHHISPKKEKFYLTKPMSATTAFTACTWESGGQSWWENFYNESESEMIHRPGPRICHYTWFYFEIMYLRLTFRLEMIIESQTHFWLSVQQVSAPSQCSKAPRLPVLWNLFVLKNQTIVRAGAALRDI